MPIPPLDRRSGLLPPGEHEATLEDVERQFGGPSVQRRKAMKGLRHVIRELQGRGVTDVWIDGSFTTAKPRPRDVDVVYLRPRGANLSKWGEFANTPKMRELRKRKYLVDLLLGPGFEIMPNGQVKSLIEFFQSDRQGRPKGVIKLQQEDHS